MRSPAKQDGIVDSLRHGIVSGRLEPGARLKPRPYYEKRYRATSVTIQRAFKRLSDEGFVVSRGRQGTFVAERPPHLNRYAIVFPGQIGAPGSVTFWSVLGTVAQEIAAASGREIVTFTDINGELDTPQFQALLADVRAERLAGIVFVTHPYLVADTPVVEAPGIPRIGMMDVANVPGITAMSFDSVRFVKRATDFLASRGRTRIALITVPGFPRAGLDAFARETARRGMTTADRWIQIGLQNDASWSKNLAQLMVHGPEGERPDGLVVVDDNLTEHVCAGVLAAGRTVPGDLDVVAHANFPVPTATVLPIERLGFDLRSVLARALGLIDAWRGGDQPPDLVKIEPVFERELADAGPAANGWAPGDVAVEADGPGSRAVGRRRKR